MKHKKGAVGFEKVVNLGHFQKGKNFKGHAQLPINPGVFLPFRLESLIRSN